MSKDTKRYKALRAKVDREKLYLITDALKVVKENATAKFNESIDVSINLGIDAKKSDQTVRGAIVLPKGTGKDKRVAVFAQGDNAIKAKEAGADIVGFDDLAAEIKAGKMDFDVVIATPDAMRVVGALGQVLGPRGLMPNPKVGTVTPNIAQAVKDAKGGSVEFRAEKEGIIHAGVGKASFSEADLEKNVRAFVGALVKARPSGAKGTYVKKIAISSTMGPGVSIDVTDVSQVAAN